MVVVVMCGPDVQSHVLCDLSVVFLWSPNVAGVYLIWPIKWGKRRGSTSKSILLTLIPGDSGRFEPNPSKLSLRRLSSRPAKSIAIDNYSVHSTARRHPLHLLINPSNIVAAALSPRPATFAYPPLTTAPA